jgi:uncharacterized membrane protein (Fun14 family)
MEYLSNQDEEHRMTFKETLRNSILILIFELIGTAFLTLIYLCHAGVITY